MYIRLKRTLVNAVNLVVRKTNLYWSTEFVRDPERWALARPAKGTKPSKDEWQVAGIQKAMASLDRGEGVAHERVREWVSSWGSKKERPAPKRSAP